MGLLIGLRPWSWTAGVVPVLITAKLQGKLLTADALRLLVMTVGAQSAGNVINSYVDYVKEIDTEKGSGDGTVLEGHISPNLCVPVAAAGIAAGALAVFPFFGSALFTKLFLLGTGLSIFYTAPPLYLKYYALGDLVILASFGPVLMQACSVALTGALDTRVYTYGLPIMLLTECILWGNNARDIQDDERAGITTICSSVGFNTSKVLYQCMVYGAYAASTLVGIRNKSPGMLLPLLTLPKAVSTCGQFVEGKAQMKEAPHRTAQLHLPFGLLMLLGLALDETVFAAWFK